MLGVQPGVLAVAIHIGGGNQVAEVAVPLPGFGQQGEVRIVGKGHLSADDGLDAQILGRFGEVHRSAQVVVIGKAQSRVVQFFSPVRQLIDVGGPLLN